MTEPARLPWDPTGGQSAKRPNTDDLGGAVLENVGLYPPPFRKVWSAERGNLLTLAASAYCRTTYTAKFEVVVISGAPQIRRSTFAGEYVDPSGFSINPVSAGIVEITWTAGALPLNEAAPELSFFVSNEPSSLGAVRRVGYAENMTSGVRVKTYTLGDVAAWAEFIVKVN